MAVLLKTVSTVALVALVTLAARSTVAGQNQPAVRGQGRGQEAPPAPPQTQAGHPSGKLVIWGDVVNFNPPGTPNHCVAQSRFKRGERIGFRMTAVDGGT